jgi:hypothetical protein
MAGSIWLPKEEADFYRLLLTFTGVSNPLKVVWLITQMYLDKSKKPAGLYLHCRNRQRNMKLKKKQWITVNVTDFLRDTDVYT